MACKANTQHLKLINKLKMIEKYKDASICLTVETWNHSTGDKVTKVRLISVKDSQFTSLFQGATISGLERFINEQRKEAGIFQERK